MNIIKEDVFRKQLKKGLSGGYLFFGEEDYLKSFSLRAAREAVCAEETFAVFNDVRIDPMDFSASALEAALMPPPMMCEQKIITVNGLAISDMKPSELEELYDVLSTLGDYDYNVLIISVPAGLVDEGNIPRSPSKTITELSKHLTLVQFDTISGSRLVSWVGKHLEHHGVSAPPEVCAMLAERCGKSMFVLASETEKLAYYVRQQGRDRVSSADVEEVTSTVITSDAYALANALLDGRNDEAMRALSVMKFRRVEPVIILSEVSRTISDLLYMKLLQSEGVPLSEISRFFSLGDYKMGEYKLKLYAASAATKSEEKLRRALLLCSEADLSLKLSPQGYTAIENLICVI